MPRFESAADLVKALRKLAPTTTSHDLPYSLYLAIRRHFGTMADARRAAKLPELDLSRRWSEEIVLAELRGLHDAGERITYPALNESHPDLVGAITMYFGSIFTARRLARVPEPVPLQPRKRQRWTDDLVIAEIEELHRSGGSLAMSKVPVPLVKAGKRYFESWENAVEAAGFSYAEIRLQRVPYTEAQLVEELRALQQREPKMLWARLHELSFTAALLRTFGDFETALARAGIEGWPERRARPLLAREGVIDALRARAKAGRPTNVAAVQADDAHLWRSATLEFGEYHLAIEAAGVGREGHNRRWTHEKLLEALRQRIAKGQSTAPSAVRRDDNSLYQSARAYFGSYANAIRRI